MKLIAKAILASLSCFSLQSLAGNESCGLPEDIDSQGVDEISSKDVAEGQKLTALEQEQVIAIAQFLEKQDDDVKQPIRSFADAKTYLLQAFRDELYVEQIRYQDQEFTLVFGWPGDNRGGYVLKAGTTNLVGDVGEDGLYCLQ